MKSTSSLVALLLIVSAPRLAGEEWPVAIADNSFLIEEAYNQEPRVVQHIATLFRPDLDESEDGASFTQEWPFLSQRHQLSYTVPYSLGDPSGLGDVLLNYRYQVGTGNDQLALAPRLSLILPTGDEDEGLGQGTTGLEVNLPVSWRLAPEWVVHANLGASHFPSPDLTSPFVGASVIWLASSRFNVMLEALVRRTEESGPRGGTEHTTERTLSPGVRFAIDRGDLQIVPGVAFPVTSSGGEETVGVFVYLSLEHPY